MSRVDMHADVDNDSADAPSRRYAYPLIVLMACSTLSYVDRQVVSLVVAQLKAALLLTDTQIGIVQGAAFTLCYAIVGIPLARAVDRLHRVRLIALCVLVWSTATMGCGLAGTYGLFLLARSATAFSEAGLPPGALSLLTDLAPRRRLARASTLFMTGPYLGGGLALVGGGWLLDRLTHAGGLTLWIVGTIAPWKALFLCVGAPGVGLALLVALTLREPARGGPALVFSEAALDSRQPLRSYLSAHARWIVPYALSTTMLVMVLFTLIAWAPTYFMRAFHSTLR